MIKHISRGAGPGSGARDDGCRFGSSVYWPWYLEPYFPPYRGEMIVKSDQRRSLSFKVKWLDSGRVFTIKSAVFTGGEDMDHKSRRGASRTPESFSLNNEKDSHWQR